MKSKSLNVSVIGAGYVGAPTGVGITELGHKVTFVDTDEEKLASLKRGDANIKDEGLNELLIKNSHSLEYTTDLLTGVYSSEILMLAVGTPTTDSGKLDISIIEGIVDQVAKIIDSNMGKKYIVVKSTVPVLTGDRITTRIEAILSRRINSGLLPENSHPSDYLEYISNPEFLEEGRGLQHTLNPNRIVVGANSVDAIDKMKELYDQIDTAKIFTSVRAAEYIKLCANVQLAVQLACTNEQANIARNLGIDFGVIREALSHDERIGKFLNPGPGFGGFCFPKDTLEALTLGFEMLQICKVIFSAVETNGPQKIMPVTILKEYLPDLDGKNVAIWGLSFKKGSDNIKESSSIDVIKELTNEGVEDIRVSDPLAMDNMKKVMKRNNPVSYHENKMEALQGCEALILMIDDNDYIDVDLEQISSHLEGDKVVIDARSMWRDRFEYTEILGAGITYDGIGLPSGKLREISNRVGTVQNKLTLDTPE